MSEVSEAAPTVQPRPRRPVQLIAVAAIGSAIAVSCWAYPQLPQRVPIHYSVTGIPNGWSTRPVAVALVPAVMLLQLVTARVTTSGMSGRTARVRARIQDGAAMLLSVVHAIVLGAATGLRLPVIAVTTLCAGVLLILVGNELPRSRPNPWFGVRTPWNDADTSRWISVQRVAGYGLVGAGCCLVLAACASSAGALRLSLYTTGAGLFTALIYSFATRDR